MPKYNNFDLDLQNENSNNSLNSIVRPELTIRPCHTDYYYCEPDIDIIKTINNL